MSFEVTGSRAPSARRPQIRINPISGLEMPFTPGRPHVPSGPGNQAANPSTQGPNSRPSTGARSRASIRPDGVPSLNLGRLANQEDDMSVPLELDPYHYKINSPDTASTVSWGTPTSFSHRSQGQQHVKGKSARVAGQSSYRGNTQPPELVSSHHKVPVKGPTKPKQPSAWDRQPCPENVAPPSERHKQQYRQYKEEMEQSYRAKSYPVTEDEVSAKVAELKLNIGQGDEGEDERDEDNDLRDQLQKDWSVRVSSHAQDLRKMDVEDLEMVKKRNKLIETVLIDQLSRSVLSDPEQNLLHSGRHGHHQPGMKRGAVRTLHDSKVATSGTATEKMLSKRVRFGARILTRIGRDAVRELMGFYFHMDSSITIYEYKMFGKTAKALPFIKRGRYRHLSGPRKDEVYELRDITLGGTLHFETDDQPLPDSIQKQATVAFRVTDLDEDALRNIVTEGIPTYQHHSVLQQLHIPANEDERERQQLVRSIHSDVRRQVRKRGVKVMTGLGRLFRQSDQSGDGRLNKFELERALLDYRIDIPQYKFDDLWAMLDADGSGYLDYGEFVRGFVGEMSEARKAIVRKAFTKIDTTRKGSVTLGDMAKFYKANQHPKVRSGEIEEEAVTESFLSTFKGSQVRGEVSYPEFEAYYEGVSLSFDDDQQFTNLLLNEWNV